MKLLKKDTLAGLQRGTYVLILRLPTNRKIKIGKLGSCRFRAGHYAYVGSAFGPGGLTGRLKHHFNPNSRLHWHIDYLCKAAILDRVWLAEEETRREHDWATIFHQLQETSTLVKGFCTSDFNCETHLFYFQKRPCLRSFKRLVRKRFPDDVPAQTFKLSKK